MKQLKFDYQVFSNALSRLESMPKSKWPEIYDSLNSWKWDDRIGTAPDDWDRIPNYVCKKIFGIALYSENKKARTKSNIIDPIMSYIKRTIGEKAIQRYWHTSNQQMTDQQFDDWWDSQH